MTEGGKVSAILRTFVRASHPSAVRQKSRHILPLATSVPNRDRRNVANIGIAFARLTADERQAKKKEKCRNSSFALFHRRNVVNLLPFVCQ